MARYEGGHHHHKPAYTYNNSRFSRQLEFSKTAGATKLLGWFLLPPNHTLKSLKMSLTLIGETYVHDDLESEISSFITAMDVGDKDVFNSAVTSPSSLQDWGVANLPNTIANDTQGDTTQMWDSVKHWYDANTDDSYGSGHIIKEGHGRSMDQPYDCIFTRTKKTHPIYGTGMMIGANLEAGESSTGGYYTPIDTCSTTIKRNVVAGANPTIVQCWVTAPSTEANDEWDDTFPKLAQGDEAYDAWVKMHDPHVWDEVFRSQIAEDEMSYGSNFIAPTKLLAVNYVETNTDQGRPSQWNCTWKFSAQIAPPPYDNSVANVTVTNLRRGKGGI